MPKTRAGPNPSLHSCFVKCQEICSKFRWAWGFINFPLVSKKVAFMHF